MLLLAFRYKPKHILLFDPNLSDSKWPDTQFTFFLFSHNFVENHNDVVAVVVPTNMSSRFLFFLFLLLLSFFPLKQKLKMFSLLSLFTISIIVWQGFSTFIFSLPYQQIKYFPRLILNFNTQKPPKPSVFFTNYHLSHTTS